MPETSKDTRAFSGLSVSKHFEELEQIADILSHDVRGSFHHITAFTDLIRKELDKGNKDLVLTYLSIMDQSTHKLSNTVEELVTFSRLHMGMEHIGPVDLDQCIDNVIEDLTPVIVASDAQVSRSDIGLVKGDAKRLSQVFSHLLDNSLKYRKMGQTPTISLTSALSSEYVSVAVKDNGIGIDEKYHDKVFDLMRRLHTETEYPGNGIGLSSCRRIIELHGGSISIDPTYSGGTRFTIVLPRL